MTAKGSELSVCSHWTDHRECAPFSALFRDSSMPMLLIEPDDGAIIDANGAAIEFYGYPQDQLLDKKISDINTLSTEQVKVEMEAARRSARRYFSF